MWLATEGINVCEQTIKMAPRIVGFGKEEIGQYLFKTLKTTQLVYLVQIYVKAQGHTFTVGRIDVNRNDESSVSTDFATALASIKQVYTLGEGVSFCLSDAYCHNILL